MERDTFLKQLELAKVAQDSGSVVVVEHGSEVLRETWWEPPAGEGAAEAGDPAVADAGFTEVRMHVSASLCDKDSTGWHRLWALSVRSLRFKAHNPRMPHLINACLLASCVIDTTARIQSSYGPCYR